MYALALRNLKVCDEIEQNGATTEHHIFYCYWLTNYHIYQAMNPCFSFEWHAGLRGPYHSYQLNHLEFNHRVLTTQTRYFVLLGWIWTVLYTTGFLKSVEIYRLQECEVYWIYCQCNWYDQPVRFVSHWVWYVNYRFPNIITSVVFSHTFISFGLQKDHLQRGWLKNPLKRCPHLNHRAWGWFRKYSISQEICTRFCCAVLCGYVIVHNEFTWTIYPYSSGLLCWHWGNR